MQIEVNLGEASSGWIRHSRTLGEVIKPLLDALVTIDLLYLQTRNVPPLYESGVVYREEPQSTILRPVKEEFASVPVVLSRGWGDCDDLAPWRVAELRFNKEPAKIRLQWKKMSNGNRMYHVLVRRANGTLEDPSRILGMK